MSSFQMVELFMVDELKRIQIVTSRVSSLKPGEFKASVAAPMGATEIVECVPKYVDGISQNLQSLSA